MEGVDGRSGWRGHEWLEGDGNHHGNRHWGGALEPTRMEIGGKGREGTTRHPATSQTHNKPTFSFLSFPQMFSLELQSSTKAQRNISESQKMLFFTIFTLRDEARDEMRRAFYFNLLQVTRGRDPKLPNLKFWHFQTCSM